MIIDRIHDHNPGGKTNVFGILFGASHKLGLFHHEDAVQYP